MCNTSISVNRKTVQEFLANAQKQKFLIPEYQRPYAWEFDHIETLFDDLVEFTEEKNTDDYFLGTVVYFINKNNEQEIIDGQQRLTSILLLLRAIYEKLNPNGNEDEQAFIQHIEPLLWEKSNRELKANKDLILIKSTVIDNSANQVFHNILTTGKADEKAKDNYSKNYLLFQKKIDDYCKEHPLNFIDFIEKLLFKTIVLPIKADKPETALTIFSTLNDRGMPLNDADIFKARIYRNLNDDDKKSFIERWQEIERNAKNADKKMSYLFTVYMFYLLAKEKNTQTTRIALRSYFEKDNYAKLKNEQLLDKLEQILALIKFSEDYKDIDDEQWSKNLDIKKVFAMLYHLNIEWWKYPAVIYYLSHKDKENFTKLYLQFLRKLFVHILQRYSIEHTINPLKNPVLKLNIEVSNDMKPKFEFKQIDDIEKTILEEKIKQPHGNLRKALLTFLAYQDEDQKELLPINWELEHIFPQNRGKKNWDKNYIEKTLGCTVEEVKELLWHIGNFTPLDKASNSSASDGYFAYKKEIYCKSSIAMTRKIGENNDDWQPQQIIDRDKELCQYVLDGFNKWISD